MLKIKQLSLLVLLASLAACDSQTSSPPAETAGVEPEPAESLPSPMGAAVKQIDSEQLLQRIELLASDEFGGRAPLTRGEQLTLDYLEGEFKEMGLKPLFGDSYRQPVSLVSIEMGAEKSLNIELPGESDALALEYGEDTVFWSPRVQESISLENSELVWVGYGIVAPEYNWNDYKGLDVKGKTVVMLVNDPGFATGNPDLFKGHQMTYYGRWTYKYEEAARQGAAAALIIHQTEPAAYGWNVVQGNTRPRLHLNQPHGNQDRCVLEGWIQHEVAQILLDAAGHDLEALSFAASQGVGGSRPLGLSASAQWQQTLAYSQSWNVGALLPGSSQADELFIYTAHWDHLGTSASGEPGADLIFNGAEDNASGTAGLLEIGQAFAALGEPLPRSVGFLAVTAEESGLLGSLAYTESPPFPMNRTVAGINMDRLNFVGKMSDVVIVGHGASEMEEILASEAQMFLRTVTPEATPEKGYYYRSDHFNFARKGVPILYARGGTVDRERGAEYVREKAEDYTKNRYHSPADEVQPDWDLEAAVEDLTLFFHIGMDVARSQHWPQWYDGNEFKAIREASMSAAEKQP